MNKYSPLLLIAFVFASTFNLLACGKGFKEMENQKVKIRVQEKDGFLFQEFFALGEKGWELVVRSKNIGKHPDLPLYNEDENGGARYLMSRVVVKSIEQQQQTDYEELRILGTLNDADVKIWISLGKEDEHFHIEVESNFRKPDSEVEYILSDFFFYSDATQPEFVHTPALKFQEDDIIGDRTFWSPAAIMQEGLQFVALVPDLNLINKFKTPTPGTRPVATGNNFGIPVDSSEVTFPTGLDLITGIKGEEAALFSFGFIDALASHHMHWYHPNDSSMVRKIPSRVMKYGFDLFLSANSERYSGYQRISKYLWENYGREEFKKAKSLAMPFEEYARLCYPASKNYKGSDLRQEDGQLKASHTAPGNLPELESWLEWEMAGEMVGGYRNNAPQWYDMIGNTTWWNNARDAVGMHRWGKILNDSELVERSKKVINLTLQAPQDKGFFPVIYSYNQKKWIGNHWNPPTELDSTRVERYFDDNSKAYHTSSMSKTAVHLLRYYLFCEKQEEIVRYVERYADFLIKNLDKEGCIPSFFNSDLTPNPHLQQNAAGGVHSWLLATLYQITKKEKYLDAAKKSVIYIENKILPQQDWKDYEVYFSCGVKSLDFHDDYTSQGPRNTLSMYWALEGFLAIYEATNNEDYLEKGALVADYLSLYQTVWQPHFITTAYVFGGFGVQNTDAEWHDARQGEIAPAFVKLGILTGRKDLIERGIAAGKSSLILINHQRHIKNNIYAFPNFPLGLGPENIDHEGRPQSPMRTNAGWGEVSGLSGIADLLYQTGDLYIDIDNNFAVGVNGIRVNSHRLTEEEILLDLDNTFLELKFPYTDSLFIQAKISSEKSKAFQKIFVQEKENINILIRNLQ